MKTIKTLSLTVVLMFITMICTFYFMLFAMAEIPLRMIGCSECANVFHYLIMEVLDMGHSAFDWADRKMDYPVDEFITNPIERHEYSVAFFDTAWRNIGVVTVKAHCEICAAQELYWIAPNQYASRVIERV